MVPGGNPISEQTSKIVLDQLVQLGVQVVIETVPTQGFFRDFVSVSNFDLTSFQWINTLSPFSSGVGLYQDPRGTDVGSNFGRIHSPEISAKFAEGLAELDPAKRIEIGNQIGPAGLGAGAPHPAVPTDRHVRGALHAGQLRRQGPRRLGLHPRRVHPVAAPESRPSMTSDQPSASLAPSGTPVPF